MEALGQKLSREPFTSGNSIDLLENGPATYAAMTGIIAAAKTRIDMESYEFDADEGLKFADLLLAERRKGVEVNLIYDAWGSLGTPDALFKRLREGGVRVLEYNPLDPLTTSPIDFNKRDHRKLLGIDNQVAITGGVNISRVYEIRHANAVAPRDPDEMSWRDTDVVIRGAVVDQFDRMFMKTWQEQKGEPLPQPPPAVSETPGGAVVQALDGAPDDDRPLIYRTLVVAITLARTSIHLTTGFFVPTPDLARLLEDAARRGVDVEIVVPAESDSEMAVAAGRSDYGELLEAGVKIFERQGRVLHAKTAVVDHAWATIGSSNLDWRSVIFNNEIDAVVIDQHFGDVMEAMFAQDLAHSKQIDLATWRARPLLERLREFEADLVATLL
jgi:cardiolipin synthase